MSQHTLSPVLDSPASLPAISVVPMQVGPSGASADALGDYVFALKYARHLPEAGRRETYTEAVDRVFAMHARKYADKGIESDLAFAKDAVLDKLVLGSQRAMQFGGPYIEKKNARMYNCTVSYADRPRFFQEAHWLLLCGAGVGFSVQKHHIDRLPPIARPTGPAVTHAIDDSIEGWADAIGALVSSYFTADQPVPGYANRRVELDYSAIRPKGAILADGTSKAPGPEPLRRAVEEIRKVFEARLVEAGSHCQLKPINAYDMLMHASNSVLSGGSRRSATICVFSPDDQEMVAAKTGNWFLTNPQRGRSNNSAMLVRDRTSRAEFASLMRSVREFGEPGFVFADSTEIMYNPCVEIGMYPVDKTTGRTGWAFCNLTEINMKGCVNEVTFERAAKAAAILGTLQAGYDRFAYLGETTERIVRREALLGCSMTGMMDNPEIAFDPKLQRKMAQVILDENARVAAAIGVNPAARATCVKPAGTTSLILGTASGIHPHHSQRYIRRVQGNALEMPVQYYQAHNPRAVEKSVWNPNGTDVSVSFCIDVPRHALLKENLSAIDLLERVKLTQENWVNAGRRPGTDAEPWLRHNVSNTITVRATEWEQVEEYIYNNRDAFAGISLLSASGDLDYPQAPFTDVWTHDRIIGEYGPGALFASGLIVDGQHAWKNNLWAACDCALNRGESLDMPALPENASERDFAAYQDRVQEVLAKKDWIRRAKKFADNYFKGDLREMTYCLKRVSNAKLWEDLTREQTGVDWSLLREDRDGTKDPTLDAACAGGKCDLA